MDGEGERGRERGGEGGSKDGITGVHCGVA